MGGEDFSRYRREVVPILMHRLGSVNQSRLDWLKALGVPIPSLHSSQYYPDADPTPTNRILAMTGSALELPRKAEQ